MTGNIKKWLADRGFGFITSDGGGPDVFAHARAFDPVVAFGEDVPTGTRVSFEVEQDDRGLHAVGVTRAAPEGLPVDDGEDVWSP